MSKKPAPPYRRLKRLSKKLRVPMRGSIVEVAKKHDIRFKQMDELAQLALAHYELTGKLEIPRLLKL